MRTSATAEDPATALTDLRDRVLAGWAASPARFREDANAEEDLALGPYRDRVVVELAQNAADAAGRAGQPGRLLLRHTQQALIAANTGAPLDLAGVQSLATLRASAKRGTDTRVVGRFGVGFAAVLAVSDEPAVGSRGGLAVRFSRTATRHAVSALPELAAELTARGGHVPALRLPWPGQVEVPDGYVTAVVLPWRDPAAAALAGRLLDEVDAALLLALPGLAEVVVERPGGRRVLRASWAQQHTVLDVDGARQRWRRHEASGPLDPALLAGRPVEERAARSWSLTWAVAVNAAGAVLAPPPGVAPVLHAPTPTDEALDLPALLVAGFPLDPGRRHVAPGPLTDLLVEQAAAHYAALAGELAAAGVDVAPLVPSPAPRGVLDGALRAAVLPRLAAAPLLPGAGGGPRLPPNRATVLEAAPAGVAAALADVVPDLAAGTWPRGALDALGVRRRSLADAVEDLAGIRRPAAWWRALYAALDRADPQALSGLPVPLADGRMAHSPRGVLLPDPGFDVTGLAGLGLRLADPAVVHPLLTRLGAHPASPTTVLRDPALAAAALAGPDEPAEAARLAGAVLDLLAAGADPAGLDWLPGVLLPDDTGELEPAEALCLPGSLADTLLVAGPDGVPRVAGDLVERYGAGVLTAVGVADSLGVVRVDQVPLDPDELAEHAGLADVAGIADWAEDAVARLPEAALPPVAAELTAVRDLDLVAPGRWAAALAALARPPLRDAVTDPVRVLCADGRVYDVPAPAAWWLRHHAGLDGRPLGTLRLPGDPRLAGLYAPVPPQLAGLDPTFLRAVGVRVELDAVLAEPGGPDEILDRLAAADGLPAAALPSVYAALCAVEPARVRPPRRLRVADGAGTRLADASQVCVADAPQWMALRWPADPLPAPPGRAAALADVLDLPLASERAPGRLTGAAGQRRPVPPAVAAVLPGAGASWVEHEDLLVDGTAVDWWVEPDGTVHAATADGLAAGLAWSAGCWPARWEVAAVLADPGRVADVLAGRAFDPRP